MRDAQSGVCAFHVRHRAPVTAFPSLPRIEPFAAEPLHEFLGVTALGKTINIEPLVPVKDGMPSRAKGKLFAELMDGRVEAHPGAGVRMHQKPGFCRIAADWRLAMQIPCRIFRSAWQCKLEHVTARLNRRDSKGRVDERVYRH
jgi:hypothetical protein